MVQCCLLCSVGYGTVLAVRDLEYDDGSLHGAVLIVVQYWLWQCFGQHGFGYDDGIVVQC